MTEDQDEADRLWRPYLVPEPDSVAAVLRRQQQRQSAFGGGRGSTERMKVHFQGVMEFEERITFGSTREPAELVATVTKLFGA